MVAALGGGALFVATRGAGVAGYVSEAGATDAPHGALYRASVGGFALALALLSVAARPVDRPAALAFAAASPFAVASGAVRCSAGCPLPPYERATGADLMHAGVSIVALLLCALTMVLLAWRAVDPLLRRAAVAATVLVVPLLAGSGLGLLFAGRGAFTGVMERLSLLGVLLWLLAAAVLLSRPPCDRPPASGVPR